MFNDYIVIKGSINAYSNDTTTEEYTWYDFWNENDTIDKWEEKERLRKLRSRKTMSALQKARSGNMYSSKKEDHKWYKNIKSYQYKKVVKRCPTKGYYRGHRLREH